MGSSYTRPSCVTFFHIPNKQEVLNCSEIMYLELHGIVVLLFQWSSTLPDLEQNERQQLFYRNLRRTKRREKTTYNTGT